MAGTGTDNIPDDLDAVRKVVEVLKPFQAEDQRRVLRWAQEKLGLLLAGAPSAPSAPQVPTAGPPTLVPSPTSQDIRSFLQAKRPPNDSQFVTAVAYYHAFEAPAVSRKSEIGTVDVQEAARLAGRARLKEPRFTLNNALRSGYLDKGSARGTYRINTVGENLVAMALPLADVTPQAPRPAARRRTKPGVRVKRTTAAKRR
jgi:hypothetical protein